MRSIGTDNLSTYSLSILVLQQPVKVSTDEEISGVECVHSAIELHQIHEEYILTILLESPL